MSDTEELTLWENIKNSRVFIQYFMLMIVMSAVNVILNRSYGNVNYYIFSVKIKFLNLCKFQKIIMVIHIFSICYYYCCKRMDQKG